MEIGILREIAQIVTNNRLRKVDTLLNERNKTAANPQWKLFRALFEGKVNTNDEAEKLLSYTPEDNAKFRTFKSRFTTKLLNTLFFIDLNLRGSSEPVKAAYTCSRNQHCIKVLSLLGARSAAIALADATLRQAIKYEIADTAMFCASLLRNYASMSGNLKEFKKYSEIYRKQLKTLEAETEARELFDTITIHFANAQSPNKQLKEQAHANAAQLKKNLKKYNTYQLHLYYFRLQALAFSISADYREALHIWKKMQAYLEKHPQLRTKMRKAEAILNQMACSILLRDYKEGEQCAIDCLKLLQTGENNWFYFMEYYFLISLQSHKLKKAGEIISEVTDHLRFAYQPENKKEKWVLFEEFYIYMCKISYDPAAPDEKLIKTELKPHHHLKETPVYSKDKRGYNIAILLIQLLYILEKKDYALLHQKVRLLRKYHLRHLRKDFAYRSNLFLQMLFIADNADFYYSPTEKNTRSHLRRLQNSGQLYTANIDTIEIIPYEDLWERVLQNLRR